MIDRRGKTESGRVSSILRHLGFRREHRDIDGSGRCVWRYFKE
jgi:hypothetical protein